MKVIYKRPPGPPHGQDSLGTKLYWLVFAVVTAFQMIQFPLKTLLRWQLPEDLDVFQLCMLEPFDKTRGDNYKVKGRGGE